MSRQRLFWVLLLFFLIYVCLKSDAACQNGRFGSSCQFMCHCDGSSTCDDNGQCPTICARGWFGLGCQYENLATVNGTTVTTIPTQLSTTWLTDGDDTTCNTGYDIKSVKFVWITPQPFTWLRINVQDASVKLNFNFTIKKTSEQWPQCKNHEVYHWDEKTVDFRFDLNETIQELTITGTGLKLCSLYISGVPECSPGTWGLECNMACPGNCNTSCHQDIGFCGSSSNCGSSECLQGRWGEDCKNVCSSDCYDGTCDKITGYCEQLNNTSNNTSNSTQGKQALQLNPDNYISFFGPSSKIDLQMHEYVVS